MDEPTIVFDTDCVLCSGVVAFILAHERDHAISFVGAWSPEGLTLAAQHGFGKTDLDQTFLVIADGRALIRSAAALALTPHLAAPWRWFGALRLVPRPLRDAVYRFIARHRYRIFGRRENCTLVPPSERHRFSGV